MKKRKLGKTGIDISITGLGAWAIGNKSYGKVQKYEALEVVKSYLEAGGNHIDTAEGYGDSEKIIGEALDGFPRDKVIIASKTWNDGSVDKIANVRKSLEKTLKAINSEYVDIYYLHSPPSDKEHMNRLLEEYVKLKEEGKIRYIGASIKGVNVTDETVELCRRYIQDGRVDVIQVVYSIFRQKNDLIFDLAREHGVGVIARTSLESGFLTGKYHKGFRFTEEDHRSRWSTSKLDRLFEEVEFLEKLKERSSYNELSHMAVKFVMQNEGVNSVIIGSKSKEQIEDNLKIENFIDLSEEEISNLKEKYGEFTELCNTD